MTMGVEKAMRRRMEDHFAGRISPASERTLRQHLPDCDECRGVYERHLLIAELDPRALDAQTRLAGGLGLRAQPGSWLGRRSVLTLAAAAAAVVVVASLPDRTREGFAPRGGVPAAAPELKVFRVRAGGAAEPVQDTIARGDELAFAYRNPGNAAHLLVFGVDEHGHVYWYHPEWSDGAMNPVAVSISSAQGLHELPAAVSHAFDGARLRVSALFAARPFTVREVEQALRRQPRPAPLLDGVVEVEVPLRVSP